MPYDLDQRSPETRQEKKARLRSEKFGNAFFQAGVIIAIYSFVMAALRLLPMRVYPPISDVFYLFVIGGFLAYLCGWAIRFIWSRNKDPL
jgi:hypothetical protein